MGSAKIETEEELRALMGYPGEIAKNKVISHLDDHCRDFIAKSPFLVLSTSDELGFCDVSPKGDENGFVHIIDSRRLAIPERPGNRRLDSLLNILSNPGVGLLFFIQGLNETLRVNGKATLRNDEDLLEKLKAKGKRPLLAIEVEVEECYIHCAKAFLRSELWKPESWLDPSLLPSAAKILLEHSRLPDQTAESIQEDLDKSYAERLY